MITFNKKYFLIAILVFVIEVMIAIFLHDKFVRPYLGDVLVVKDGRPRDGGGFPPALWLKTKRTLHL